MSTVGADTNSTPSRLQLPRLSGGLFGTVLLLLIALPCFFSLYWTLGSPPNTSTGKWYNDLRFNNDDKGLQVQEQGPGWVNYEREVPLPAGAPEGAEPEKKTYQGFELMGTDEKGRSLFVRCLLGGAISLGVGISAALMSVFIGVTWGAFSGYIGGRTDAFMMRVVDILYGLPYLLLVVLLSVAVSGVVERFGGMVAKKQAENPAYEPSFLLSMMQDYPMIVNLLTLVVAIGGVSWLTMARVIRGQVLSLRSQPFIEAARAQGMGAGRIIRVHLLPNLVGPIIVYTTLAIPQAILQESFLSFLGIGVTEPLASWGQLASEGIKELPTLAIPMLSDEFKWWVLVFPCVLLGLTLLSLNFMGDALRERFDPRSRQRR